jgi:anti-sigma regulatory factor (Ser/Thr protein kinase)
VCTVAHADELSLATGPQEVGLARRFAVRVVAGLGADEQAQEAIRTLVSELVTNVVLHAGTRALLTVEDAGDSVRVLVTDGSAVLPRQRRTGADSTTGRGLRLLQALSAASGTEPSSRISPHGKTVWFTVRKHTGAAELDAVAAGALALFDVDLGDL